MRAITTLLLGAILTFTFEGCSSDDSSSSKSQTVTDGGACNAKFCPSGTTGTPCCAGKTCGFDYGQGCVATQVMAHKDGG